MNATRSANTTEANNSNEQMFQAALGAFAEVARSAELDEILIREGADLATGIRDFRVLVPVVGSFNAGKTSIINAYLGRQGRQGLPTAIVPQTALATEIHPAVEGDPEEVELLGENDGVVGRLDLDGFGRFETDEMSDPQEDVQYARVRLRSEALQAGTRIVLVDMPGLDSGIRNHNAAIQRYLPLGSYFVLVFDVERGTLRESEIVQLREFLEREVEFTVLANKADRKQADRDEVVAHIAAQVRSEFGKDAPVHAVSAHLGDIGPFAATIESIDPDRALRNYWRSSLLRLLDQAIASLHTRYSAINVSSAEAEDAVNQLERSRAELEAKLAEDEREIHGHYSQRATDAIVRGVRNAIRDRAETLASAFESGGTERFEQDLNELVRATLNRTLNDARAETESEITDRYRANVEDLDEQLRGFTRTGSAEGGMVGSDLGGAIRAAGDASTAAFTAAAKHVSSQGWKSAFSAAAGVFGVLTNVVAPWLEVVLVLLPWILDRFGGWQRRQEEEQRRRVQLRNHIANTVAPKIASELRGTVADDYARLAGEMLSRLRSEMQVQIERVQADIRKGRANIEAGRQEAEAEQERLAHAVRTLTVEKGRIESA
ncbi:MAG: dynamin family protein [Bryobacterales bacterium]|nr:dynamin family protein [Bryobacterales bacterium]